MLEKTIRKTPLALAVSTALLLASQGNVMAMRLIRLVINFQSMM